MTLFRDQAVIEILPKRPLQSTIDRTEVGKESEQKAAKVARGLPPGLRWIWSGAAITVRHNLGEAELIVLVARKKVV